MSARSGAQLLERVRRLVALGRLSGGFGGAMFFDESEHERSAIFGGRISDALAIFDDAAEEFFFGGRRGDGEVARGSAIYAWVVIGWRTGWGKRGVGV